MTLESSNTVRIQGKDRSSVFFLTWLKLINSERSLQVGDNLDGLLEELHYLHNQVEHADPIAANPDSLREQINENNVSKKPQI